MIRADSNPADRPVSMPRRTAAPRAAGHLAAAHPSSPTALPKPESATGSLPTILPSTNRPTP
jgi:hypothetical protein